MRSVFPVLLLCIGLAGLGWWSSTEYAPTIEHSIREMATEVVADISADAETEVSGRDITVRGLAASAAEKTEILMALEGVEGRRSIIDLLEVLPQADPYVFEAEMDGALTILGGHAPDEAQLARLNGLAAEGGDLVTLASGAPDAAWADTVKGAVTALSLLERGSLRIEGATVAITGKANDPGARSEVHEVLAALPEGYQVTDEISVYEAARVALMVDVAKGITATGVAPEGFDGRSLEGALGVTNIWTDLKDNARGDASALLEKVGALQPWIADFEAVQVVFGEDGVALSGEVAPGVDTSALSRSLVAQFGSATDVSFDQGSFAPADDGATRVNAVTGMPEVLRNGYWLAASNFEPSVAECSRRSQDVLGKRQIVFEDGSIKLDRGARVAVNELASIVRQCIVEGGLSAEVTGHTDNARTEDEGLTLSYDQANRIVAELVERGIPSDRLAPVGYGPNLPIADNETEEGRMLNRRIELNWLSE